MCFHRVDVSSPYVSSIGRLSTVCLALFILITTSPAMSQQWSNTFGGPDADLGYDLTPTSDGGVIAVGFTSTELLIDGFVVKTDAQGEQVWQRSLSLSPLSEVFYSVIATATGGAIVAGSVDDPSAPNFRPWLVELDAQGDIVWSSEDTYTVDLPVDSGIIRAAQLNNGNLAVIGGSNGFSNPEDPWLLIVDGSGNQLSFEQFETLGTPGFGVSTYVNNLTPTTDGGFAATGTVAGGLGFGFLWKFDANGQPQWDRLYQSEGFREGYSVRQLADGGFVMTGCDLPNCNNTAVVRTDAQGQTVWTQVLDDPNDLRSFGRDVLELADGTFRLLQNLSSAVGSSLISSQILSLSSTGTVTETRPLDVGQVTTAGYRLSPSATGDIWAAGYSNETTDPGQIDLFVTWVESDTNLALPLFSNGFESGTLDGWSTAVP